MLDWPCMAPPPRCCQAPVTVGRQATAWTALAPLRARDGMSCAAACESGEAETMTLSYLESACQCAGGAEVGNDGSCGCPDSEDVVNYFGECGPDRNPELLAETIKPYNENQADAVLMSVRALLAAGASPNAMTVDGQGRVSRPLGRAALMGWPRVVSVLLTAGADPDSLHADRNAAQHAARGVNYPHTVSGRAVMMLRHFIGGLGVRGLRNFDWNRSGGGGSALNLARSQWDAENNETSREVAELIYERGGRCDDNQNHMLCGIPADELAERVDAGVGEVLTITVRDFGGGCV